MTGNMRRLRKASYTPPDLPCFTRPAVEHLLIAVPLPAHRVRERFPRIGREAETEARDHRGRNGAAADIVLCRGALRRFEHIMEKPRRVPIERPIAAPGGTYPRSASFLLGRGMFARPRQKRHGIREREILDLHDEVDDAAALAAAEAVVDLLIGRNGERWRFLAVERAQAEEVRPALFCQPDVLTHHVHNVVALGRARRETVREMP